LNTKLVQKDYIKEWLRISQAQTEEIPQRMNEESLFLSEKQKVMVALASASSKEEFERTLQIKTSIHGSNEDNSEAESSPSSPYPHLDDL